MSVCLSVCPSVRLSVRLKLKISVTAEPIGLYFSGIIPTGPVMVLGYFLGGWDTPNPPKKWKTPPQKKIFFYFFFLNLKYEKLSWSNLAQPLEARGEAASL